MNDSSSHISRFRPRAQSLFEYRARTNTELTLSLLDRLISSRDSSNPSNETTNPSDECEVIIRSGTRRTRFFIGQPLVAGFLVFPLLILFWQAGWNFALVWLATPIGGHWIVLPTLYFSGQLIFLFIYLNQDHLYDFLHKRKMKLFISFVLQMHTLITASTYIIQWVSMWTIWDRYTSGDWLLMLIVSIAALLGVIAVMGHPCDLVCAPFILSYDSVEYNIRIGSPFITDKVINLFKKEGEDKFFVLFR
jgi:cation transport ATPase